MSNIPDLECCCDNRENEGFCVYCGSKFCGMDFDAGKIGCGLAVYKCVNCGGAIHE